MSPRGSGSRPGVAILVDSQWDPADLTRYRSDRSAVEFTERPAEEAAAAAARRGRWTLIVGLVAVAMMGAAAFVLLRPAPPLVTAAGPTPAAAIAESVEPPPPPPTPVPSPSAAAVQSVDRILAITYPTRVSALTARDEQRILDLVAEPIGEDQRVLVSGFAGYDWSTEAGAKAMSLARARTIQDLLQSHGVESSIVAYGATPADSILGAAMTAAIPRGYTDNLLAFLSVVQL